MTLTQGLLSLAFSWHVVAMVVGAVPALDDFGNDTTPPRPPGSSAHSQITAMLDRAAVPAVRLHRIALALTTPLHRPVRFYLDVTDQFSKWNMFSSPSRFCEYVRLDYVFVLPDGTHVRHSELVYPAAQPGAWKMRAAYFASFVDKAFANGAESYQVRALRAQRLGQAPPLRAMQEDLLPFLRYYGRRRAALLPAGTQLARAEFWRGNAPSPRPGTALPAATLTARQRELDRISQSPATADSTPADAGQAEAEGSSDITWRLWVVDGQ